MFLGGIPLWPKGFYLVGLLVFLYSVVCNFVSLVAFCTFSTPHISMHLHFVKCFIIDIEADFSNKKQS